MVLKWMRRVNPANLFKGRSPAKQQEEPAKQRADKSQILELAHIIASSFAASLELVREGTLEIRQTDAFAPLYMRQPESKSPNAAQG